MSNFWKHLKIVHVHRKYVRKLCFKLGILWRGLAHDLSKYSIAELKISKWFSGTNSPHQNCREKLGYSPSWMHHYHRNDHHYLYWMDTDEADNFIPVKMPYKCVLELFADRVAACKAYNKEKYTNQDAWNYYLAKTKNHGVLHKETEYLLEKLLWNLHESATEDAFFEWFKQIRKTLKHLYDNGSLALVDNTVAEAERL